MKEILEEIDRLQKEIQSYKSLNHTLLKQIKEYYRIAFTYTSNALEGNSLTETETKIVLEDGVTVGGKPLRDHFEAIGHSEAYDFLYSLTKETILKEKDIQKMHAFFYFRIDKKNAGKYRKVNVIITGSKYPLPLFSQVPQLMNDFMEEVPKMKEKEHPVVAAAKIHKEFVFIHPFVDGNGRVARLLMNLILFQNGYNISIIPPVLRREYVDSLEKAHVDEGDFLYFIARMVRETQKDYIRLFLR